MAVKTRGQLIKERASLQTDLNKLINQTKSLRSDYNECKTGVAGLINLFGWLPSNAPNPYRIASINEIERVVKAVELSVNARRFNCSPTQSELTNDVDFLEAKIHLIKGVVAFEKLAISNVNSKLYQSLDKIVLGSNEVASVHREAYELWLEKSPKTDEASATLSSAPTT